MSEDPDHLDKAAESTREGISGLLYGIYHYVLGFSQWTKSKNVYIQATITGIIFVIVAQAANVVGSTIFTTFWGQAAYISGIKLRLIPIPLSLLIYSLTILFMLYGYSLASDIRDLNLEIDKLESEVEKLKERSPDTDD